MRTIDIAVSNDGTTSPGSIELGHLGEHNVVQLHFKISTELERELSFFRVSAGEFLSDSIKSVAGDMYFTVPAAMLSQSTVFIQLNGYKLDSNEMPTAVFKSDIILGNVHESLNSGTELPTEMAATLETLEEKSNRLIYDLDYKTQVANLTYSYLTAHIVEANQAMNKYVYYISESEKESLAAPERPGVIIFELENGTNDLKNVYISYSATPAEASSPSSSDSSSSSGDSSSSTSDSSSDSGSDSESEVTPVYRWLKLWGKESYIDRGNLTDYAEPKPEIVNMNDGKPFIFQSNKIYIAGEEFCITPKFDVPESERDSFCCELRFTSGSCPTAFYPDSAYYTGADCSDGVFVSKKNRRYNICYWYDGGYQGAVRSRPLS